MPALVLLSTGNETRYELSNRPVVVGRSVECDVQVSEERASRRHFQVEPTDRGWALRDLGSSNGTALNGYAVSRALLTPGDEIEVGGMMFRFDADGAAPGTPKGPRAERKPPSQGPAWVAAMVSFLLVAAVTDVLAVESARGRDAEVREAESRAAHAEWVLATKEPDAERAEEAVNAFLRDHPNASDAGQARARLETLRNAREIRKAAGAEFAAFATAAPNLSPDEHRWRLESLVRRWTDSPEAMAEIRRRAAALRGPAPPAEDSRVLFQRRKREADAAAAEGNHGRALALWNAHALESPPATPSAEADLRAEVRRIEDGAYVKVQGILDRAISLRDGGKVEEARKILREALPSLEGTAAGRRLAARLESGFGAGSGRGSAGAGASDEGYARRRALYLKARDAEQFVALRDYSGAAALYAAVASEARDLPDVKSEMDLRTGWLRRVADLLDAVRAAPGGRGGGKSWPATWDEVPAEELFAALSRASKKPEDRLALAAFAYDQGLAKRAVEAVGAALENEATRAEAEKLYSLRAGVPVPEGGFAFDRGEVISREEWKRRKNSEAIGKLREKQASLVKRLHGTTLVRGIEKMRERRMELDKARAHALDLIFDEVKYFYPYRDRMAEYAPVSREVDERVDAVRKLWDDKTHFVTKSDPSASQVIKELEETAKSLRDLGAERGSLDAEFDSIRRYMGRDLDIRSFFLDEDEFSAFLQDQNVLRENTKRHAVADELEWKQVEITNEYRAMFNRRALLVADKLVLSARAHCNDMDKGGFFAHENTRLLNMKPGEKVPKQACGCSSDALIPGCTHGPDARIRAQGYEFIACSENIHSGSGDPKSAHEGWAHSSGHHRNLLHTAWKEMGTGRVGGFWTQNFGLPPVPEAPAAASDGVGSDPWDRAGGRGTGGDGNPPEPR